jgi:hypothetical protein
VFGSTSSSFVANQSEANSWKVGSTTGAGAGSGLGVARSRDPRREARPRAHAAPSRGPAVLGPTEREELALAVCAEAQRKAGVRLCRLNDLSSCGARHRLPNSLRRLPISMQAPFIHRRWIASDGMANPAKSRLRWQPTVARSHIRRGGIRGAALARVDLGLERSHMKQWRTRLGSTGTLASPPSRRGLWQHRGRRLVNLLEQPGHPHGREPQPGPRS